MTMPRAASGRGSRELSHDLPGLISGSNTRMPPTDPPAVTGRQACDHKAPTLVLLGLGQH